MTLFKEVRKREKYIFCLFKSFLSLDPYLSQLHHLLAVGPQTSDLTSLGEGLVEGGSKGKGSGGSRQPQAGIGHD